MAASSSEGEAAHDDAPVVTPLAATDGPAPKCFRVISMLLMVAITCAMLTVLGRVAQIQLRPSPELLEQVTPRVSVRKELPLRGDITDRRGRLLAATRFTERVIIDPTLVEDPHQTAKVIAKAIDAPEEDVGNKLIWAMTENQRRLQALAAAQAAGIEPVEEEGVVEPPATAEQAAITTPGASAAPDASAAGAAETPKPKKPIRYLALSGNLSPEQVDAVRQAMRQPSRPAKLAKGEKPFRLRGVSLETLPVRDFCGGSEVANLVGLYGWAGVHKTGMESSKDPLLGGKVGKVGFVRDASGSPLWVEQGQIQRAAAGGDVALSLDLEIQRIAIDELTKGVEECDAQGGRIIVMDPMTGQIIAMADVYREVPGLVDLPTLDKSQYSNRKLIRAKANEIGASRARYRLVKPDVTADGKPKLPGLGRNRCVEDLYEPGSTFKPFVWSTLLDMGKTSPNEVFDTEGGGPWITPTGRAIKDVHGEPSMTWAQVLINSSNIGMIKGAQRLTPKEFHDGITRFGFGSRTRLGLAGETAGMVTPLSQWKVTTHTSMSYGNEVGVTAVQMVRGFSAFARDGELAGTLPRLSMVASDGGSSSGAIYRVLSRRTAETTRETLRHVVTAMESKYAKAMPDGSPWKYTLFGKSGTSRPPAPPFGYLQHQYVPSFIAAGPIEAPRLVALVVIDDPGPARVAKRTYYGAATAGPIVHRTLERALTYLGVPPSRRESLVADSGRPME